MLGRANEVEAVLLEKASVALEVAVTSAKDEAAELDMAVEAASEELPEDTGASPRDQALRRLGPPQNWDLSP